MEYFIGLDMGTSSVGWAVTDLQYKLIRKKGKDLWGIREFEEATSAVERRTNRTNRRRKQREKVRIGFVKNYFCDEIAKADPNFLQRLNNSKYYLEDKDKEVKTKNGIFDDENYKDADYFKQYPTIFHLKKDLIESKEPKDIRLVYLAILNMFKHRGHFLNEGIGDDGQERKIGDVYNDLRENILTYCEGIELPDIDTAELEKILSSRNMSRSVKAEKLAELMSVSKKDKEKYEIIKGLCGLKFDLNKFLKLSDEKIELDFTSASYDDTAGTVASQVGNELFVCVELMKEIYDIALLADILKGEKYLSFAMVSDYEKHHKDLVLLKKVIKKYKKDSYDMFFKSAEKGTYSEYVNSVFPSEENKAQRRIRTERNLDNIQKNIYDTIKKLLKDIDDDDVKYILDEIEKGTFLPKQRTSSNGVIPNQVHRAELKVILKNAETYLPFLKEKDESGLTVSERILQLFSFRVPYYVGPVTENSQKNGGNGWVIRKEEGAVLPWNIDEKIDMKQTSEEFIKRLVRRCTYLYDEKVLPKASLLYERFAVLNEINNIKIKNEPISVEMKQDLYNTVFKLGRRVTRKQVLKFFNSKGLRIEDEDLSGIDTGANNSLSNYGKFHSVFGDYIDTDEGRKTAENIIYWCTVYGDSKKLLRQQINEKYPSIDEDTIKRIIGFKLKDWGRISRELLEIEGVCRQTGEIISLIDAMWETNFNFMELINSEDYSFKEEINNKQTKAVKTLSEFEQEDLEDMYFSAPVKKMIWQTILIVREITKIMGNSPEKVFIEMTRSDGEKGKRTDSRKKELDEYYKDKDIKKEADHVVKELVGYDESGLRNKKLYLYFKQLGRDMYTGNPINISDLSNDNLYDIDHIYPRHFVKDDSIHNNLVLVNKQANARKSDKVPLESSIRENKKVRQLWELLRKKNMITEEKYKRLTRNIPLTDKEKEGFIARQIVETGQGTKGIADIFKQILPETEIVYSKAGNVSDFRKGNNGSGEKVKGKQENVVKFPKVRSVNDFHHAHDAYLNIVVGNVYNTKFTKNPMNFIKEYNRNPSSNRYNMDRMFDWDVVRNGQTAWKAGKDGTIETVQKMLAKNTPLMTRAAFEGHGGIANQTLYSKNKATEENYIPLKASDPKMQDVKKYGGYTSVSTAYFFLVEHTLKKKRVRTIETVPIYFKTVIESTPDGLDIYCKDRLKLVDSRVIIKKIPIQSLIKLNGFFMHLSGKTNNQLLLRNAVNLIVSKEFVAYIKLIDNAIKYEKLSKEITAENNIALYDELCRKHMGIYSKRPNPVGEKLTAGREKFISSDVMEQVICLSEILKLSSIGLSGADLSLIGGAKKSGVTLTSKNITGNKECKLIYQSPTGVFEREIDMLSEDL